MDHSSFIIVLAKQDKPATSHASIDNVMPFVVARPSRLASLTRTRVSVVGCGSETLDSGFIRHVRYYRVVSAGRRNTWSSWQ
jgi:hypothetical protein